RAKPMRAEAHDVASHQSNGGRIAFGIKPQSAPLHILTDAAADLRSVFPDPATKDDRVGSSQSNQIGAEILANTIAENLEGHFGSRMVLSFSLQQDRHIIRQAR